MALKSKAGEKAAWTLDEADDPADWSGSFSFLREMDSSLRCELCYVSGWKDSKLCSSILTSSNWGFSIS
jgi:hypothetical protein